MAPVVLVVPGRSRRGSPPPFLSRYSRYRRRYSPTGSPPPALVAGVFQADDLVPGIVGVVSADAVGKVYFRHAVDRVVYIGGCKVTPYLIY